MVFIRSAITPPKVNRLGWTMWAKCGGWPCMADLCSSDSLRGSFFQKRKNCSQNFQVLRPTSSRHNSTMITNAENSRPNGPPTGCRVSIFSGRELAFTFAICYRRSVCLSVVCNVGAPYSAGWNFRQFFSPYDSPGTLVFWCQNSLLGDAPFP